MARNDHVRHRRPRQASAKGGKNTLAETPSLSTWAPKGRYGLLQRSFWRSHHHHHDGVSVAATRLEDNIENMGAQLVKEVATKTNDTVVTAPPPRRCWLRLL